MCNQLVTCMTRTLRTIHWFSYVPDVIMYTNKMKGSPARGERCSRRHKIGHFAAVCCSVKEVTSNLGGNNEQFFPGAVNSCDKFEEPWNVVLHINQKPMQFKIDTGTDISVTSVSTYQSRWDA